ncbi:hypothetical protein L0337_11250 [candidate division KSB1 bacterium]|nr:hypothetical protein [candidate division KSB1 bacterium]
MAQEILVKEPLEKEKVEAGKELLSRLAKTDFKIAAALWLWSAERPRWKLILASPAVSQKGVREAYNNIDNALYGKPHRISELELPDVHPMDTTKPLIKALRAHARKYHTNLAGERLKEYWLGDVSIDDAYVYFVK